MHAPIHPLLNSAPAGAPTRRHWLAGVLAAAAAPAFIRHARAADQPRFGLGLASGFPRPDGMVLWTRLTGPGLPQEVTVQWEVATDEAFRDTVARGTETAEAAWGYSVHAEPAGLLPGRGYHYRFRALGDQSPAGRTRTAPAPDAAATLAFAITSCQHYEAGHYAAWREIAREPLDLVLFLGDYIYEGAPRPGALRQHEGTGETMTLDQYRARYATYKSDPALQAAHAACPWLYVWDDHEVSNDYADLQGQEPDRFFHLRRAAAYQAAWEHQPLPKSMRPRGADMRIYGQVDWGRLARVLLLDDRQYRSPQACPKPGRGGSTTVDLADCAELKDPRRTLLGRAQEEWLAQAWDTQRPWNLLAQQTLMARFSWADPARPGGGRYWTDGWDGYAPARNRLLAPVAERKLGGVVVLGGDVHSHYVADLKRDFDDAPSATLATEFCGTSISSTGLPQERLSAALPFNPHIRYGRSDQRGYTAFRLDERQLQARLMTVDNPLDPASPVRPAQQFTVEAGRPGAQA